ncbi:ABC transporter permease [Gemmatimonadota bacterium]
MNDLRYAARMLTRRPMMTTLAVISLSVGIGATTTVFTMVNELLLRAPTGVRDPSGIVEVGRTYRNEGFDTLSWPNLVDLREQSESLEVVAAWRLEFFSIGTGEGTRQAGGFEVTWDYFSLLGTRAAAGRFFRPSEGDVRLPQPYVVISHTLWSREFGASETVIGRNLSLNGEPFTIIGVAEEGFGGHTALTMAEVWIPLSVASPGLGYRDWFESRRASWLMALARKRPGQPFEKVLTEVASIGGRLQQSYPVDNADVGLTAARFSPLPAGLRDAVATFVAVLMGVAVLVLVVACLNVAGLLLAQAANRRREIGIRLAMGASRVRVIRLLLSESVVLFLLAGGGGLLLATWGTDLLLAIRPPLPVPLELQLPLDTRVLVFSLVLAVATGVISGLAPALQSANPEVVPALRDSGRQGGFRASRLRTGLVIAQVSLSMLLLVAGGLLGRSLLNANAIDPGFTPEGVYLLDMDLARHGYGEETGLVLAGRMLAAVDAIPEVESVALATDLPLDQGARGTDIYLPEGPDGLRTVNISFNQVTVDYFRTLRIPILEGRAFEAGDITGAPAVAVVSEELATRLWQDGEWLGRTFRFGSTQAPLATVIGVVGETKNKSLTESSRGVVYVPLSQQPATGLHLVARIAAEPGDAHRILAGRIVQEDADLSFSAAGTLKEMTVDVALFPQRLAAGVAGLLGIIALFLASIGLYGLVAFAASQRTHEVGIRMALGAERGNVLGLLVRQGLGVAGIGILTGLLLSLAAGRLLVSLLVGIRPFDLPTLTVIVALLGAVSFAASFVPGRRASRLHPMEALRYE